MMNLKKAFFTGVAATGLIGSAGLYSQEKIETTPLTDKAVVKTEQVTKAENNKTVDVSKVANDTKAQPTDNKVAAKPATKLKSVHKKVTEDKKKSTFTPVKIQKVPEGKHGGDWISERSEKKPAILITYGIKKFGLEAALAAREIEKIMKDYHYDIEIWIQKSDTEGKRDIISYYKGKCFKGKENLGHRTPEQAKAEKYDFASFCEQIDLDIKRAASLKKEPVTLAVSPSEP